MNYSSHRVGGICAGIVTSLLLIKQPYTSSNLTDFVIILAASELGSLLPDIDEPSSVVGKKVKPISKTIKSVAGHRGLFHTPFFGLILTSLLMGLYLFASISTNYTQAFISRMIEIIGGLLLVYELARYLLKKKIDVVKVVWCVVAIPFLMVEKDLPRFLLLSIWGLSIGYFSHLLMDMLTVSGIPLLYPITDKKFRILRLKTNKHEAIGKLLVILPTLIFIFVKMGVLGLRS